MADIRATTQPVTYCVRPDYTGRLGCHTWCMAQRRRKVLSVTIPDWIVKEAGERYGNVSEFAERAMANQLRLDRQVEALEGVAGDGDPELGRRLLDEIEARPEYPVLAAKWDADLARVEAELRTRRASE